MICKRCKRGQSGELQINELLQLIPEDVVDKIRGEYCQVIDNFFFYSFWIVTVMQLIGLKQYVTEEEYEVIAVEWTYWIPMLAMILIKAKPKQMRLMSFLRAQMLMFRITIAFCFAENLKKKFNTQVEAAFFFGAGIGLQMLMWILTMNLLLNPWLRLPFTILNSFLFMVCCTFFTVQKYEDIPRVLNDLKMNLKWPLVYTICLPLITEGYHSNIRTQF